MRTKLTLLLLTLFICSTSFAQDTGWGDYDGEQPQIELGLDAYNPERDIPKNINFASSNEYDLLIGDSDFASINSCVYPKGGLNVYLQSADGEFEVWFDYQNPYIDIPSLTAEEIANGAPLNLDSIFMFSAFADLEYANKEEISEFHFAYIDLFAKSMTRQEAQQTYNADAWLSYPIDLNGCVFKDKYPYLETTIIQKNERGYLVMECFFTEKGYSKKEKYENLLKRTISFNTDSNDDGDEQPQIESELDTYNPEREIPKNIDFAQSEEYYLIFEAQGFDEIEGCGGTFKGQKNVCMKSDDGEFEVWFDYQNPYIYEDITITAEDIANGAPSTLDSIFMFSPFHDFKSIYEDKISPFNFSDLPALITPITSQEAQEAYNADAAVSYHIDLQNCVFKEKYTHLETTLIQKNGIGYLVMDSFYTDEGYKNKEKYDEVKNMTRFKNNKQKKMSF